MLQIEFPQINEANNYPAGTRLNLRFKKMMRGGYSFTIRNPNDPTVGWNGYDSSHTVSQVGIKDEGRFEVISLSLHDAPRFDVEKQISALGFSYDRAARKWNFGRRHKLVEKLMTQTA